MMNKWENIDSLRPYNGYLEEYRCPKCGENVLTLDIYIREYIYCPHCGLKVLEDEDAE